MAVYVGPTLAIALALATWGPAAPNPLSFPDRHSPWAELAVGALAMPFVETWLLIWPTAVASTAVGSAPWRAAFIGAMPVVLLHGFASWLKPVAVAWAFVWSARCYLELRDRGVPFWRRFAFVLGMHAGANALALSWALLP